MNWKRYARLLFLGLAVVLAVGCGGQEDDAAQVGVSAQTNASSLETKVASLETKVAAATQPPPPTAISIATSTPEDVGEKPQTEATVTSSLTPTPAEVASLAQSEPTATPAPTDTPSPTDTPGPTATVCNMAVELAGVNETYSYWYVNSHPSFGLVLRNSGSCPWPEGTTLLLASNNPLGWPTSWDVGSVPVGSTQVIDVQLQAPSAPEVLHIVWRLEGPAGPITGPEINYDLRVENPPTATPTLAPPPPTPVASGRTGGPKRKDPTVEGFCGDGFTCKLHYSDNTLYRLEVKKGSHDGDGISHVDFEVFAGGSRVHQRTEKHAGFCIFGGGEPHCNPWPVDGSVYKWPGGASVEEGQQYTIVITAFSKDSDGDDPDAGQWFIDVSFDLR